MHSRMLSTYHNYINGKWHKELKSIEIENPATGQVFASVGHGTKESMNYAIQSGHAVFKSGAWSKLDVNERFRVLINIANKLKGNLAPM
jgi:acyl-CoA reductase-like NAD-dependent aldehyde dehydrogenase